MDRTEKPHHAKSLAVRGLACFAIVLFGLCASSAEKASATPALVIDMGSGAVLYEDHATQPWYPASLTKLMTVYVALSAVRDHRIALDTPLTVSPRAASMPPSKMQFPPGTLVTLDNALKMLMVKSANDIAVVIAEGVAGSVEAFAEDMNEAARSLGLTQSHFVNPNGLPDPQHISSARDMAILARALYLTFPEHANLFGIGALRFGGQIIQNHNNMLGRYPGVDGMKTGFTCAAGFNLVASATQGGRKLIAVVLGAPNVQQRTIMTAALFDRGFAGIDRPSGSLMTLSAAPAGPPDQSVCRKRGKLAAQFSADLQRVMAPLLATNAQAAAKPGHFVLTTTEALARPAPMAPRIALVPRPSFDPVPVFIGAPSGYAGLIAQARPAHSPLGTPPPPGTVSAYAPTPVQSETEEAGAPLSPDAAALPMKSSAKRTKTVVAAERHGAHHRHGARTEIGSNESDAPAPSKKAKKGERNKAAAKKAAAKEAKATKAKTQSHSKATPKLAGKEHPAAKAAAHAEKAAHGEKAKPKKPEKHAKQ